MKWARKRPEDGLEMGANEIDQDQFFHVPIESFSNTHF